MDFTVWSGFGLLGVALYLTAYAALQFGILRGSSVAYTVMNLTAAAAVLLSLVEAFNLSSALIQVSWIVLSLIGLVRIVIARSQTQFNAEERAILAAHFPTLAPPLARQFLRLGVWQSMSAGTILTRQGSPANQLIYIASGMAEVRAHGAVVANVGPGALIGEMSIMHGADATADVELTHDGRVFALPRGALQRELESDHEFALAISRALQIEAQRKIDAANRATAAGVADANSATA